MEERIHGLIEELLVPGLDEERGDPPVGPEPDGDVERDLRSADPAADLELVHDGHLFAVVQIRARRDFPHREQLIEQALAWRARQWDAEQPDASGSVAEVRTFIEEIADRIDLS
jgi:hypothetical protein